MSSTPKHVVMYEAFGWQAPLYAHVGLLQNNERQKYSKRKGEAGPGHTLIRDERGFPGSIDQLRGPARLVS